MRCITGGLAHEAGSWQVRIVPNDVCAARCIMSGAGLTIATAGLPGLYFFQCHRFTKFTVVHIRRCVCVLMCVCATVHVGECEREIEQ